MTENDDTFAVLIDGRRVQSLNGFLRVMSASLCFPTISKSMDSYNDWARDLSWIETTNIRLLVCNYSMMLAHNKNEKNMILDSLFNIIIPWWNGEYLKYVVGQKEKNIEIILID